MASIVFPDCNIELPNVEYTDEYLKFTKRDRNEIGNLCLFLIAADLEGALVLDDERKLDRVLTNKRFSSEIYYDKDEETAYAFLCS